MKYKPISCTKYDQIESLAIKKHNVNINYISEGMEKLTAVGIIENVYSKKGAEYLLINELEIRLDKITEIIEFEVKI